MLKKSGAGSVIDGILWWLELLLIKALSTLLVLGLVALVMEF
ncbi:hypothetical protein RGU72_12885 [Undibacterium sp. 5I1]|nr:MULTISPECIES: hypothetical protein [unclassified Undibacterium]MDY7539149.1 hypothetical protein [Undibacterium sp. 5I1]